MSIDLIYIPQFLSPEESTALFAAGLSLPFKRKQERGGPARHASVEFTAFPTAANHRPLSEAPPAITHLRARLSEYSGKDVNNLSVVRYETGDFFDWHQHRRDHEPNSDGTPRDATVYVISCGVERPFATRPEPPTGRITRILAESGSLIVLPASYNRTHKHAVPKCAVAGTRIAVNAQHRDE